MLRKRKTQQPPDPTKYDRLRDEDLWLTLETDLGEATFHFSQAKQDDPEMRLALMDRHLESALMACRSLRTRMVAKSQRIS